MAANPTFNALSSLLRGYGLGALFTVDAQGNPGGWLWQKLMEGVDTAEELWPQIEQTDVFRNRFSAIVEQQRRAAAGQPVYVMSPSEVLEYEQRARQLMSASNIPPWFYDQPEDLQSYILNDISLVELERKLVDTYDYVQNAPPEVKAKFSQFFGTAQTDAALAAFVLDPGRTVGQLEKARRSAYAAGMAERFEIGIDRQAAERIAQLPRTEAGIVEGLEQINRQKSLFQEGLFERGDLTPENEGVSAVFEGDANAITAIQRRQIERNRVNQASTGGAAVTQQGVVGAGYASRG